MKVIKKNEKQEKYDKKKLQNALVRAAKYSTCDKGKINSICNIIHTKIIKNKKDISTQEINDLVEKELAKQDNTLLEAYIHYRIHVKDVLKYKKSSHMEIKKAVDEYAKRVDWRVKENSNSDYSFSGLMGYIAGKVIANYAFNEIYPKEISNAHREGDYHIHDAGHAIIPYCCGWSLEDLIKKGFQGVPNKVSSNPAKHLSTLFMQMINFIGVMQMEHAGAQAFSSFDTYCAPFVRTDKLTYKEIKQQMQLLIYNLNVPSRWGSQAPFTNLTLDWTVPKDMKDKKAIVNGVEQDFTYGDCQAEMDLLNKAFLETMLGGDAHGRIFYYPIPTINVTKQFDWNSDNTNLLMDVTSKYGYFYFANFISSDMNPEDARSMCCRLRLDLRELSRKNGGLFGAGEKTGSIGVVTINLAKIGYVTKTKKEYFERLAKFMELAKDSLEIKRKIIENNLKEGLMPYARAYINNYDNHFSTIGLVGMHESCQNFLGKQYGIETPKGKEFAIEVLKFMREKLSDFQEETSNLYNLEATPAESTAFRLAMIDKKKYPNIITSGDKHPIYTNSTQLPVDCKFDIVQALEHQDELQNLYTGGTVLHTFLGEAEVDREALKKFIKKAFTNHKMPYISITPTFSVCKKCGYLLGEHFECPKCKEEEIEKIQEEINILEEEIKKLKN